MQFQWVINFLIFLVRKLFPIYVIHVNMPINDIFSWVFFFCVLYIHVYVFNF